jgi:hypothetical protein
MTMAKKPLSRTPIKTTLKPVTPDQAYTLTRIVQKRRRDEDLLARLGDPQLVEFANRVHSAKEDSKIARRSSPQVKAVLSWLKTG